MLKSPTVLFVSVLLMICCSSCLPQSEEDSNKICFSNGCISVEIARSQEERAKGFQHRHSLDKDKGMLFIFPKSMKHSFWMKDTFLALDIIWINKDKRIVTIMPGVLPCKTEKCPVYTPDHEALYVLEVNSGVSLELGLKVGDHAYFE